MGQAASRQAAKQATRAVRKGSKPSAPGAAAPAARPPPLGRPEADAPEVVEDATVALKERQQKESQEMLKPQRSNTSAPSAPPPAPMPDANSGFYRGQISDPRDVSQEKFLAHQSGSNKQEMPEMAPDLLKFLQDAGPLEKKVNKEYTSPRIVKELETGKSGEESEKMHRFEAAQRTRDDMRLVEDIDGFSTPRTTNFFTSAVLEEEEADFGLTDLEIYDFLKRGTAEQDSNTISTTFHQEKLDGIDNANWTNEEHEQQKQLLKNSMNFLALPVVIKDDQANYIGVYQKELDKEFAHEKVDIVDESRVKLVLADLHDLGKKEIRRIR